MLVKTPLRQTICAGCQVHLQYQTLFYGRHVFRKTRTSSRTAHTAPVVDQVEAMKEPGSLPIRDRPRLTPALQNVYRTREASKSNRRRPTRPVDRGQSPHLVRSVNPIYRGRRSVIAALEVSAPNAHELLETAESMQGPMTASDVDDIIDKLRPPDFQREMDVDELEQLARSIRDTFTLSQLESYMSRVKPRKKAPRGVRDDVSIHLHATPWTPGVTPFEAPKSSSTRSSPEYAVDDTVKDRTVKRLLRHCWGLEMKQDRVVGEAELRLSSRDISLLLSERR